MKTDNTWDWARIKSIIRKMSISYLKAIIRWMIEMSRKKLVSFISKFYIKDNMPLIYTPIEGDYSGYKNVRMTERGIELYLLKKQIEKWKMSGFEKKIIEVGAVSPYVFPELIEDVLDPYDAHTAVNLPIDLFDFDFTDRYVISISTIEHVATGDYGVEVRQTAMDALDKIMGECKECLITIPVGYNTSLDKYIMKKYSDSTTCYKRGKWDNNWKIDVMEQCINTKYSKNRWASALFVIKK